MLIYKIINDINDRIYIGQTKNPIEERIREYKNEINYTSNPRPIIAAMQKYGFENFHFIIIEDNIRTKEEMDEKERMYIQQYHSLCSENGYNVELGGNSYGKHSEETKRKIGEAQLGEKNHMYGKKGYDNACSKEVIELTTGNKYGSASVAAEELKLNFSHVCAVCRGERGSTGGYVFRYIQDEQIIQPEHCTFIKNKILPEFQYLIK